MADRDPFENFERMRREMYELFGDVFERGLGPHRRRGFRPAVDVYYAADPPRAVVQADLAGIDPAGIELEIAGRELIISGRRQPPRADGRSYQQVEIEHGPFRRVVALGVDVDADRAHASYQDGMLIVELPLAPAQAHAVPVQPSSRRDGDA